MFDYEQTGGASDSWVSRWREWRGIDQWPMVRAKVLRNEYIESGEGGYHKLELTYCYRAANTEDEPILIVTWLSANTGTKHSTAHSGDEIDLFVNPECPDKPVFSDTENAALNLIAGSFIGLVFIAFFLLKGCGS